MLKEVTLGQYFPVDSLLHRTDPRMKIVLMFLFMVATFFAKSLPAFLYLSALIVLLTALSRVGFGTILSGLRPILFLSLFTAILNIFFTTGEVPLFEWHFIRIYAEGLWHALYMVIRIVALVVETSVLLSYTTTPMQLTDGLDSLLSPLAKMKIPVHEFTMMMSLALRFIPTLLEETDKIIVAQKARGADFENGSLLSRAKALVPVLIPLFVSSFRRASELAVAMECRGYTGTEGRTRMKELSLTGRDWAFLGVWILLLAGIFAMNLIPLSVGRL